MSVRSDLLRAVTRRAKRAARRVTTDTIAPQEFDAGLAQHDRLLVLYEAEWCRFCRAFAPAFEAACVESSIPFARADLSDPLDPRWDDRGIRTVPTVVYYEHGEELERQEALRGEGLDADDFAGFLETVEALQEQWRVRRGRVRLDKFG